MSGFKRAERKQVRLKLAMTGPSGSGKTFSALVLAKGLGGKIAVIDTENGSASLYSNMTTGPLKGIEFDVMDITPPFTTEKYIDAINLAEKSGYGVIVIDSLTHAWAGEGGLLEQKAQLDARPGTNHWANWKPIDVKDTALKNAFLHSNIDVIATMRSKMEYTQSEENGKKKVEKLGMAPIQRDGLSYDFTIVFDLAMNNEAAVSKDRTSLFAGTIFKVTEETAKKINTWRQSGAVVSHAPVAKASTDVAPKQATSSQVPKQSQGVAAKSGIPVQPKSQPLSDQKPSPQTDEYLIRFGKVYAGKKMGELDNETITAWHKRLIAIDSKTLSKPQQTDFHETISMLEIALIDRGLVQWNPPQPVEDDVPMDFPPVESQQAGAQT